MYGIVKVFYTNGQIEIYEVDDVDNAVDVYDAGVIDITPDQKSCITINKDCIIKITCEGGGGSG
ncbi:hypothetical protein JH67_02965 [Listeria monocytogenes]|nr:hypothetical protein [Listeria monocytogenes]